MGQEECVTCETCPALMTCPETWQEAMRRIAAEALEEEGQ